LANTVDADLDAYDDWDDSSDEDSSGSGRKTEETIDEFISKHIGDEDDEPQPGALLSASAEGESSECLSPHTALVNALERLARS
jgi:hypothetical protein